MATQPPTFEEALRVAQNLLETDHFDGALEWSQKALSFTQSKSDAARAFQVQGLTRRKMGDYVEASEALKTAVHLAEGEPAAELLLGRIHRDLAMAYMDMMSSASSPGAYFSARFQAGVELDSSERLLREGGGMLECAVTIGFIGRYYYLIGNTKKAAELMLEADAVLRNGNNRVYELNNLIWLLKVRRRLAYYRRILRLIKELDVIGGTRHQEARIIFYGSDGFYRLARKLLDARHRRSEGNQKEN